MPKSRKIFFAKTTSMPAVFMAPLSEALDFRFYGTEMAAVRKKVLVVSAALTAGPVKTQDLV